MNKKYIKQSFIIFTIAALFSFILGLEITKEAAMSLVAFFSVVYSFYILSTSILFGSNYSKKKYRDVDSDDKTGMYYIKKHLRWFGWFSIVSIALIIVFALMNINNISFLNLNASIICLIINPILIGISTVNVYYMTLMLKFITNALVEEAMLDKD